MFKNAMKYGGIILGKLEDEIKRRRTFCDNFPPLTQVKTTLTEKFLLYGGAIAQAGAVKVKELPPCCFRLDGNRKTKRYLCYFFCYAVSV